MKNPFKIILGSLALLFSMVLMNQANGQTATIDYNPVGLTPGSTIQVPVRMTGTSIGNWQLIINYDRDVLTYVSTANTVAALGGFFSATNVYSNVNLPGGGPCFKATYAMSSPGLDYSASPAIFTITFVYNGGNTALSFVNFQRISDGYGSTIAKYLGVDILILTGNDQDDNIHSSYSIPFERIESAYKEFIS